MSLPTYFRHQAERCIRLSRSCFDLTVAEQLRIMAEEFLVKAREFENPRGMVPPRMTRAVRPSDGDVDRDQDEHGP